MQYRGLADGRHRFRVRAVDRRGGRSAPATHRWIVDTRRPPRPALTERPALLTSSTSASFAFADPEPAVVFRCSLDLGAAEPCVAPRRYDGLGDGAHRFIVTATDAAGNTSAAATHVWTIDLLAPARPTLLDAPPDPTATTAARFVFAAEPGTRLECALDGGEPASCGGSLELSGLSDGEHSLTVTAVDAVANRSAPTVHVWTVDTVAPAAPVLTARPAALTPRTEAELAFTAEAGASLLCRLDRGAYRVCTSPQSFGPLADGAHTFAVVARDAAGNRSATSEHAWTIDTTLYRSQVTATAGLIAYWRLGETSWGPAADERGAYPGAYSGGVGLGHAGALVGDRNAAAGFDGLSGEMLAATPALSTSATVEGWFQWRRGVAVMRDDTGASGGWILAYDSGGRLAYRAGGSSFITTRTVASLRDGWHHLALTKSGGDVAYYVDGQLVHTAGTAASNASLPPWHLMNNGTNGEQYTDGRADEVAVYDVALAPSAVLDRYRIGSGS